MFSHRIVQVRNDHKPFVAISFRFEYFGAILTGLLSEEHRD